MDQPPLPHEQQDAKKNASQDEQSVSLSRQVADLLSRLRLMEERYANLRREHQLMSQNMIDNHQSLSKQERKLSNTLLELKRSLHDLQEQLGTMQGELAEAASSYDLKALEHYVDMWQPLQFLTRSEAEKLIEEATRNFYKAQSGGKE